MTEQQNINYNRIAEAIVFINPILGSSQILMKLQGMFI